jgi:hypothetical protein
MTGTTNGEVRDQDKNRGHERTRINKTTGQESTTYDESNTVLYSFSEDKESTT